MSSARDAGRRASPDLEAGRRGWLVAGLGIAAAVVPASGWTVPGAGGVPYPVAFAGVGAVAVGAVAVMTSRRARRRPGPMEVLAILTGVAAVLGAATLLPSQPLRDLGVYLRAGDAFGAGRPVYLHGLMSGIPADRTAYPFLYPPPLLPILGALAALPRWLVQAAWVVASVGLVVAAFRALGLPLRWALAGLVWRPVFEGLWVGNVALPLFACLAVAWRRPAALILPPAFKAYSGTAALWLVRERRWRSLGAGAAVIGLVAVATLPFTGLDAWRQWFAGLEWFARSQSLFPDYLYGIALTRYVGAVPALAVGLVVLGWALAARGREGLARLAVATPALSPSVFVHGLLAAIPAMLGLRPAALWIGLAAMAFGVTAGSWIGPALAVAAWGLPTLRRTAADLGRPGVPDPLAGADGPWAPPPEAGA